VPPLGGTLWRMNQPENESGWGYSNFGIRFFLSPLLCSSLPSLLFSLFVAFVAIRFRAPATRYTRPPWLCQHFGAIRSIATRLTTRSTRRRIQLLNSTDRLIVAARVESALCKAVRAAATPLQGRRSFGATVDRVLHFGATVGTAIQTFKRRYLPIRQAKEDLWYRFGRFWYAARHRTHPAPECAARTMP